MKRLMTFFLAFCFCWLMPVSAAVEQLSIGDIQRVVQKMFSYHIENKRFHPALVRRCIKIYIEQFDPEKCYLLESEVLPYLALSDAEVSRIIEHLEAQDYSDFFTLNALIETAISRAQKLRRDSIEEMISRETAPEMGAASSKYAVNEMEIAQRQKNRMVRFYLFHKNRTTLDSFERRQKVFALFENKMRRAENQYLLSDPAGLSKEKREHLSSLRILKAFAKSLDTHPAFFSPEEAHEMRMSLEKQFEGVGVVLSEGIDGVMITELIKGSPAEESGLIQINDLLVEIDGENVLQNSFEEVIEKLKKKDRGEIILGFKRFDVTANNETFFQVPLKKKPIVMNEERIRVGYEKHGDGIIGKIALYSFYETADGMSSEKDIKEALRALSEIGPIHGLVLDLRENSGGFLSQAVKVAGLFVSNGVIVVSKYAKG